MKLRNLTPHPITIHNEYHSITLPREVEPPRLEVVREPLTSVDINNTIIPVVRSTMGEPVGLPPEEDGVLLVVSALVAEHPSLSERTDLVYPGEAVRDSEGKIVGSKGLCAGPGFYDLYTSKRYKVSIGGDNHNENGFYTIGPFSSIEEAKEKLEDELNRTQFAYYYGSTITDRLTKEVVFRDT